MMRVLYQRRGKVDIRAFQLSDRLGMLALIVDFTRWQILRRLYFLLAPVMVNSHSAHGEHR